MDGGRSVVELVRRVPGWEDAEPTVAPIEGGITNRNFRVDIDGRSFVVRLPGERTELLGIDRAGEAEASRRAAALDLSPAVIAELPGVGTLITEFVAGEPATTEDLLTPGVLEDVAASIGRLHRSGRIEAHFPIFRVVEWHARDAAANRGCVPAVYAELHQVAGRIARAFPVDEPVLCHNDLLPATVLLAADRHWLIDFEYAGMNEALFDLANLSVNCRFDDAADERLLTAYDGDASDRRPRRARPDEGDERDARGDVGRRAAGDQHPRRRRFRRVRQRATWPLRRAERVVGGCGLARRGRALMRSRAGRRGRGCCATCCHSGVV